MVWILELTLVEVDRQVTQKMEQAQAKKPMGKEDTKVQGMYPSTCVESTKEQVPKNVLETETKPSALDRLQYYCLQRVYGQAEANREL